MFAYLFVGSHFGSLMQKFLRKSTHVWQALSEVLSNLHRMASFLGDTTLNDAVGNGMLRDALQEAERIKKGSTRNGGLE